MGELLDELEREVSLVFANDRYVLTDDHACLCFIATTLQVIIHRERIPLNATNNIFRSALALAEKLWTQQSRRVYIGILTILIDFMMDHLSLDGRDLMWYFIRHSQLDNEIKICEIFIRKMPENVDNVYYTFRTAVNRFNKN